jgi:hypothetical protein
MLAQQHKHKKKTTKNKQNKKTKKQTPKHESTAIDRPALQPDREYTTTTRTHGKLIIAM